jgi:hypothetical protein
MSTHTPLNLSENYRIAWAEYRRLRKFSVLVWLLGLPVIGLLILPTMWLPSAVQAVWSALLGIVWILLFLKYSVMVLPAMWGKLSKISLREPIYFGLWLWDLRAEEV